MTSPAAISSTTIGEGERLDSWKEIALYLRRGARTVQRWERDYDLPVHRAQEARGVQVFAFTGELDAWWESQADALAGENGMDSEPDQPSSEERLDSWKEIAAYLGRGSRTVQRWEREEGLPVRRLQHDKRGSIYAFKSELDQWRAGRGSELVKPGGDSCRIVSGVRLRPVRRIWSIRATVVLAALGAASAAWRVLPGRLETPKPVEITPLTSFAGCERHPSFSPDGTKVAFDWDGERQDNQDIYVKPIGAEQVLRLTTDPRPDADPAWAPDGNSIAFLRSLDTENDEIWLAPSGGGPARKITEVFSPQSDVPRPFLAWSPDSQWLVVPDKSAAAEPYRLTLVRVKTGEKRPLTAPPAQSMGDSAPAVSPDGRTLAFVRCTTLGACDIYTAQLRPDFTVIGQPARLTAESKLLMCPNWAHDGHALVYLKATSDVAGLWRIGWPDAGAPRLVLGKIGYHPTVSRQGDKLAYSDLLLHRNIYRIDLDQARAGHASPVRLINSTRNDLAPDMSPDGQRLLFFSTRGASPELWVANADGSAPRQLTTFSGSPPTGARWSQDGRRIVFESGAEGNAELYVMDSEGGALRRLTNEPSNESVPSWSRDGRFIYFSSDRTGRPEIWKMPAAGGPAIQITRGGGNGAIESVDGRTLYYAKAYGYRNTSLWQVPAGGGEETEIVDGLWSRYNFAVAGSGIFLTGAESAARRHKILFYRFAGRKLETVAALDQPAGVGLSVWPAENPRFLFYAAQEKLAADIMLVRNLRP